MSHHLSSKEFFEQLEVLNLAVRRILSGERKGEHFSLQSGGTVEFSDHRAYTPGDDLRYLDWNVFARHGELFIKEFAAEEEAHILLIVDGSRSMDFGSPNRFQFARKICAALAYVTLAQFDTCSVLAAGKETRFLLRRVHGKRQIYDLIDRLEHMEPNAKQAFDHPDILRAITSRENTTAILLSDFYDHQAIRSYLRRLRALQFDAFSIHLLTPEELDPEATGSTEFVDRETGEKLKLTVDMETLEAYHEVLQKHLDRIRTLCLQYGSDYARLTSTTPLVSGIIKLLQTHKFLR